MYFNQNSFYTNKNCFSLKNQTMYSHCQKLENIQYDKKITHNHRTQKFKNLQRKIKRVQVMEVFLKKFNLALY